MATKISEMTELATAPATGDLLCVVDVSDLTGAASGTTKKITAANAFSSYAPIADPTFTGEIGIGSVNVSETELGILEDCTVTTTILNNLSGTNTGDEPSASTTTAGVSEIATSAEVNTGTDTGRTISPDSLAGSNYGRRVIAVAVTESDTACSVADGKTGIPITAELNGWDIIDAYAHVYDQGVTGTMDIQIRRRRAGANVDVLSTKITVGAEYYANDGVINTSNDDLATGDMLFIDVDAIHSGTAANGLTVSIIVSLP